MARPVTQRGKKRHDTLRALATSIATLCRRAAAFGTLPPGMLADLDSALDRLNAASGALARAMHLANPHGIRLAAIPTKSPPGWTRAVDRRGPRRAV
jgi:hypothetical protein